VGKLVNMLVVHVVLQVDRLVAPLAAVVDMGDVLVVNRLVSVVARKAVRAGCILVLGTRLVEDMLVHHLPHQVMEADKELHHQRQLVDIEDIDEVLGNQDPHVVVAGKGDQAVADMQTVEVSVDRQELVPSLVLELSAFPMMLFWCCGQYKILFRLEFSFLPNQVAMVHQLMARRQQLEHLHALFLPQRFQQLLALLLLAVVEFLLLFQLEFWILP